MTALQRQDLLEEEHEYAFPWLDDDEWSKAYGQARLKINGILGVFNCYGLHIFITPVLDQIMSVLVDFSMRVRGEDHPIGRKIEPFASPTERD